MKEHSDNLDCTQFVLTSSECRVHHGPREVVVIGPKVPIGVERYHSRAVAEPHLYDLHGGSARDQRTRVEVP